MSGLEDELTLFPLIKPEPYLEEFKPFFMFY
jgi:hypothetical protein